MFVFGSLISGSLAHAAKPKIAVVPYKGNTNLEGTDAGWIKRLYRWALRQRDRIEVMEEGDIINRLNNIQTIDRKTQIRIKYFRRYLEKGQKLCSFNQARYAGFALKALEKANKLAPDIEDWVTDPGLFTELYLLHGLAYLQMRNGPKTREYVLRAAQFNPDYQPDEGKFPEGFVKYFNTIRNWVKRNARYSLTLNSTPSGAKVYYNQRLVGKTPVTISEIPLGRHIFRVERNGYKTWKSIANFDKRRLGSRTSLKNTVALERDPKALTLEGIPIFDKAAAVDPLVLDRLESMRDKLGVDYIHALEPKRFRLKGGEKIVVLYVAKFYKDAKSIEYTRLPIGSTRSEHRKAIIAQAMQLEQRLAPVARRVAPPVIVRREPEPERREPVVRREPEPERRVAVIPPPRREPDKRIIEKPEKPQPKGESVAQKWWFWTIIGVVVVGAGAVTAGVLIAQSSAPPSATFIVTTTTASGTQ
ncbi:MAG: PEGA domain-containing protein [Myxococcales bacterium]|nr:PEGA domain-containing protein [Myxococcales bacterium]